jgi:hypothetical protein
MKVVMPSTAYDAKGLLIAAVYDGNPVMYIDDRWLYAEESHVPEEMYKVPIGVAAVRRPGDDVTIVASSWMTAESLKAADVLAAQGISCEVIDLRSIQTLGSGAGLCVGAEDRQADCRGRRVAHLRVLGGGGRRSGRRSIPPSARADRPCRPAGHASADEQSPGARVLRRRGTGRTGG